MKVSDTLQFVDSLDRGMTGTSRRGSFGYAGTRDLADEVTNERQTKVCRTYAVRSPYMANNSNEYIAEHLCAKFLAAQLFMKGMS